MFIQESHCQHRSHWPVSVLLWSIKTSIKLSVKNSAIWTQLLHMVQEQQCYSDSQQDCECDISYNSSINNKLILRNLYFRHNSASYFYFLCQLWSITVKSLSNTQQWCLLVPEWITEPNWLSEWFNDSKSIQINHFQINVVKWISCMNDSMALSWMNQCSWTN